MILNELLAYICHFIHNSNADNLKKIITNFYSNDEIINAKRQLWDVGGPTALGNFPDRKSTSKRDVSAAHMNDIYDAIIKLDNANNVPIFVARNFDRIPFHAPEEMNMMAIVQRITNLEKSRDTHEESLSSLSIDVIDLKETVFANTLTYLCQMPWVIRVFRRNTPARK